MVKLYIQNNEVDLFPDETIVITSRIKDIRDVSKVFTDFTQTFEIPASGRNNRVLERYFDNSLIAADSVTNINISTNFKNKVPAEISIDGISYKEGYIKYNKATFKNGKFKNRGCFEFFTQKYNLNRIVFLINIVFRI